MRAASRSTIDYTAAFDANLAGLFRVEEKGEAYALAKSESIQARRFLPSFDEPGFKAPFDITLIGAGRHAGHRQYAGGLPRAGPGRALTA
jgi:aminopeptidase N